MRLSEGGWSDKEKRLYHRLMTMMLYWMSNSYQMLRIDLTSAVGADSGKLRHRYKQLRRKIETEFNYTGIENFIIETIEGNGVLHMILAWRPVNNDARHPRKFFVPKQWLSDEWAKLHDGSIIVYVKEVTISNDSRRDISRYLVSQYMAKGQGKALVRYSYSWGRSIGYPLGGLWRLFKDWHFNFKGYKRSELIELWERFVMGERINPNALTINELKLHYPTKRW